MLSGTATWGGIRDAGERYGFYDAARLAVCQIGTSRRPLARHRAMSFRMLRLGSIQQTSGATAANPSEAFTQNGTHVHRFDFS